jgi:hypothetical protein
MKKTEIAAVIFIGVLVAMGFYFLLDTVAQDPFKKTANVEYMDAISNQLAEPDVEVFNREAVNPTVEVEIGKDGEPVTPEGGGSSTETDDTVVSGTEETE